MPNDATHRIINYLVLVMFIVTNFYFSLEDDFTIIIIFIGSYILCTEIFSPDLDIYSKPSKRLGVLSWPIRKFSRHRGIGHNIFVGWLLKAIYIFVICVLMLSLILIIMREFGYGMCVPSGNAIFEEMISKNVGMIVAFLAGLFLSNAVHIIADKIL